VYEEVDWVDQVAFENKCGVGKVFIKQGIYKSAFDASG
jgi:hypothetical protein